MFQKLNSVPKEYFYKILLGREGGKYTRLKGLWSCLFLTGIFTAFSNVYVKSIHPEVAYATISNRFISGLFFANLLLCLIISFPGLAKRFQKTYWAVMLFAFLSFEFSVPCMLIAIMGLQYLPFGFVAAVLCIILGGVLLNVIFLRRVVKRITLGHYSEKGKGFFDDKNGKIEMAGFVFSAAVPSVSLPACIYLNLIARHIHIGNMPILILISFLAVFLIIFTAFANYFPVLYIYCVDRFPTTEFSAKKPKRNRFP